VCFVPLLPPSRRVAWPYGQSSFLVWCETHASAKRPAAVSAAKRVPKNEVVIPKATGGPSALETGWLMVAGWIGSAFRLLGQEDLPKEDRRDGVPFALVLFAVAGIIVAWFNVNQAWAQTLDAYTVGGFFGRLAFALPVILIVFAGWLFSAPLQRLSQRSRGGGPCPPADLY
jgi:hypothetical protein